MNQKFSLPATTLGNNELIEIGRVIVHYGLLVSRIREFVCDVCSVGAECSVSISSSKALQLFPRVLQLVQPFLMDAEKQQVRRAMERLSIVQGFIEHARYASWGVSRLESDGSGKVVSVSFGNGLNNCVRVDRRELGAADLNSLATTVTALSKFFGDVFAETQDVLSDVPQCLRQSLKNMARIVLKTDFSK